MPSENTRYYDVRLFSMTQKDKLNKTHVPDMTLICNTIILLETINRDVVMFSNPGGQAVMQWT